MNYRKDETKYELTEKYQKYGLEKKERKDEEIVEAEQGTMKRRSRKQNGG
jgi:hypothetical protein